MSRELIDPNSPAGAIIEKYKDGSALRNDRVELQPANKNPWYVMATIFGEQEEWPLDIKLADKNRRAWNGWVCRCLSEAELAVAMKVTGLSENDLIPLNGMELAEIERLFQDRMGKDMGRLPLPTNRCCFDNTFFPISLEMKGFVFPNGIYMRAAHSAVFLDFSSAYFLGESRFDFSRFDNKAIFSFARFNTGASFYDVKFVGQPIFSSTCFSDFTSFKLASFNQPSSFHLVRFDKGVNFQLTNFRANTCFSEANFCGSVYFNSANFDQNMDLDSASFCGKVDFSSATFNAKTIFDGAKFKTHVPEFHAASLYDDTTFTLPDDPLENWPPLQGEDVMSADDQKRAYSQLRLFMNQTQQIDEEQFFHRQEMRCKRALADKLHRPLYTAYEKLSDNGNSVIRPLGWLAGVIGVVALVTGFWLILTEQGNWGTAWGWSIANTFPFFGFNRLYFGSDFAGDLSWWLKTLGGIQTAFSFILLFLLGLGLRNRFRLR